MALKPSWIFTRHLSSKLLALSLALALFFLLDAGRPGEEILQASVRFVHVPEGLEINPDEVEPVTVVLQGSRESLAEIRRNGLGVVFDCSSIYRPGHNTISIGSDSLKLPIGVSFVRAIPSQLRLTFEQTGRRQVEVAPQIVGADDHGYRLEGVRIRPAALTVIGPSDRLDLVDQVATDPVDVTGVVGRHRFETTAFLHDPYLRFAQNPTVTVEVLRLQR